MLSWDSQKAIRLTQVVTLGALTFMAYSSVIYVSFSYDDVPLIIENQYLRSWSGLWGLLHTGRPVRALSFWLDYQIWGLDARGFHFTNILLHIACVLCAFYLVQIIFRSTRLAFLSALIYALHPINTEAVTNVAHRKEMFCFVFMALSFIAFKKSKSRKSMLILSFVFYLLALLSKQVALVLPLLFLLEEYLSNQPDQRSLRRVGFWSAVYIMVVVLGFIVSLSDFKLFSQFQPVDFLDRSYWSILATQFKYFPKYLWMAFFPAHLNVDHYIEYAHSFSDPKALFGLLLFLTSLALLSALVLRRSPIAFALGWLLLNLLPVLNFIPSNQIFSERYLYIPSLGSAMLIALAFDRVGQGMVRYIGSGSSSSIWFLSAQNFVFLTIYFAGFIYGYYGKLWIGLPALNFNFGRVFIPGAVLLSLPTSILWFFWNQRGQKKPIPIYQELIFFILTLMLGAFLYAVIITYLLYHRWIVPIPDFTTRYKIYLSWLKENAKPDSPHFNLISQIFPYATQLSEFIYTFVFVFLIWGIFIGLINRFARRFAEQSSQLFGILLLSPLLMLLMFAQTRIRTHDWGAEASIWKASVRENPSSFVGWNNLGRAYVQRNKLSQAMLCFAMAHSVKPYSIEPILNLGNTSLRLGNLEGAEHYYRWALLLDPNSFVAQLNLGNCLASRKEYHQAIASYLEALRIKPDSFEATYNLALCFLELGDRSRAQLYLLKTLQLAPEHHPSRILLEQLKKPQR